MRSKQELKRFLRQYDSDHAEQGGLAGVIRKRIHEAGKEAMSTDKIAERLFPDLPEEELAVLGNLIDREIMPKLRRHGLIISLKKAVKTDELATYIKAAMMGPYRPTAQQIFLRDLFVTFCPRTIEIVQRLVFGIHRFQPRRSAKFLATV
jgi:hypothetical protein